MFTKMLAFHVSILALLIASLLFQQEADAQWNSPTPEQLHSDRDRTESCPNCNHNLPSLNVYGWRGSPYFDNPEGGCRCGQKSGLTWYNGYHHWPNPFSVLLDHGRNGCRNSKMANTQNPRLRDVLDRFGSIRLLPPVRCDNGHTGRHCDPYGLLGQSRRGVVLAGTQPVLENTSPPPVHAPQQAPSYPPSESDNYQASRFDDTRIKQFAKRQAMAPSQSTNDLWPMAPNLEQGQYRREVQVQANTHNLPSQSFRYPINANSANRSNKYSAEINSRTNVKVQPNQYGPSYRRNLVSNNRVATLTTGNRSSSDVQPGPVNVTQNRPMAYPLYSNTESHPNTNATKQVLQNR